MNRVNPPAACKDIQRTLSKRLMTRRIGRPLHVLEMVDSTNDAVKEAGEAGEAEGLVVMALGQRRGRGRRGRNWVSNPGQGLYMSVLLRPAIPPSDVPWMAMLGGVATLEAVRSLGVGELALKWPNDVLARGRKIAGVLVEPRMGAQKVEFLALGIGLNINQTEQTWTAALNTAATSCLMEGVSVSLGDAAFALLDRIECWYLRLMAGERNQLLEAWVGDGGTDRMPEIA